MPGKKYDIPNADDDLDEEPGAAEVQNGKENDDPRQVKNEDVPETEVKAPEKEDAKEKEKEKEKEPEKEEPKKEDELEKPEDDLDRKNMEKLEQAEEKRLQQETLNIRADREKRTKASKLDAERKREAEKRARIKEKARKEVNRKPAEKEKPKANPYAGTVNAREGLEEDFLRGQANTIRSLRYLTREVTTGGRRGAFSSNEFRGMKRALYQLDQFMKKVSGSTTMSKAEMEEYERLTLGVLRETNVYLKKKSSDREKRVKAGKEPASAYEIKRTLAVKEIQDQMLELRKKMYEDEYKRKIQSMRKKQEDQLHGLADTFDQLVRAGAENKDMKAALEETVVKTLFYMNRMDSLEKNFKPKPGASFKKNAERLDKDMNPMKQDLDNIRKSDLTQTIVNAGVKAIKEGRDFGVDDIRKLQQQYIRKNAKRLIEEKNRRENLKNLSMPGAERQLNMKPKSTMVK